MGEEKVYLQTCAYPSAHPLRRMYRNLKTLRIHFWKLWVSYSWHSGILWPLEMSGIEKGPLSQSYGRTQEQQISIQSHLCVPISLVLQKISLPRISSFPFAPTDCCKVVWYAEFLTPPGARPGSFVSPGLCKYRGFLREPEAGVLCVKDALIFLSFTCIC